MSLLHSTEGTFCASVALGIFIISVSQPSALPLAVISYHLLLSQKSVPEKSSRLKKCVLIMSEIRGEGGKEAGRGKCFCSTLGMAHFQCTVRPLQHSPVRKHKRLSDNLLMG